MMMSGGEREGLPLDSIVLGDCIEEMRKIPDESIDMCFADPPFNLKKKYGTYNDNKPLKAYLKWCEAWLDELVRVLKPTGSLFVHQIPRILFHFAEYLSEKMIFKHWIAWDAPGAPLGKTLLPNHYGILWFVKTENFKFYDIRIPHERCRKCGEIIADYGGKKERIHPFGTLASDVWTDIHRIRHKSRRDEHPCQLPVHLIERLILMTTDEGDVVLDPFVGTGTTCIAAKKLGRRYIGIDIDRKYVEIARNKLEDVQPSVINGCYVSIFLGKVVSLRDKDFDKIKDFLERCEMDIGGKKKEMRLPFLKRVACADGKKDEKKDEKEEGGSVHKLNIKQKTLECVLK